MYNLNMILARRVFVLIIIPDGGITIWVTHQRGILSRIYGKECVEGFCFFFQMLFQGTGQDF